MAGLVITGSTVITLSSQNNVCVPGLREVGLVPGLLSVTSDVILDLLDSLIWFPVCLLRICEGREQTGNCAAACEHARSRDQLGGKAADILDV